MAAPMVWPPFLLSPFFFSSRAFASTWFFYSAGLLITAPTHPCNGFHSSEQRYLFMSRFLRVGSMFDLHHLPDVETLFFGPAFVSLFHRSWVVHSLVDVSTTYHLSFMSVAATGQQKKTEERERKRHPHWNRRTIEPFAAELEVKKKHTET